MMGANSLNPKNPLASKPFVLSLSKGRSWFDRLTTNGFSPSNFPNGLSGFMRINPHLQSLLLVVLFALFYNANAAHAADYVSVGESSAILYDAPSLKAKKLFVVNRYMPFEQVVTLYIWVEV